MISRKTRLMSVVAVVLMLVSMFTTFVLPASADDTLPVFDASGDIHFTSPTDYNAPRAKDYATYAYADYNEWIVADADDWRGIVEMGKTGNFSGKTIHLVQDINMGGVHVDPVATAFAGTLNGHDFEFQNFKMEVTVSAAANIGLFAQGTTGSVIANVGIANGLINVTGDAGANGTNVLVGAFVGGTCSTSFYKCWNGANITVNVYRGTVSASGIARTSGAALVNCYNIGELNAKATYTHGVRAAGLADWAGYTTFYNGFSAGPLVGAAGTAATTFTTNTNGVKGNAAKNLYAFGHQVILNDAHSLASALPTVGDDAYTTGELAWSLNANYEAGKDTEAYPKVYYTMEDGKTVFGKEANQTRKLTVNRGDKQVVTYVNAGTKVEYPANSAYVLTECTAEGYIEGEDGALSFTMPTTDVTVTYNQVGIDFSEAKALVEKYAPYAGNFDKFVDGEAMEAAYNAAVAAVAYEGNTEVDETTVNAAIEEAKTKDAAVTDMTTLVDTFTDKETYNAPNAKDYELFAELNPTNWIVADADDWRGIVKMGETSNFSGKTIHLVDNIVMDGDVAPVATAFAGKLDGHGFVFQNLTMNVTVSAAANIGLFAQGTTGSVIANVGIANGLINVTGDAGANGTNVLVGAFVGGTCSTSFYKCWNGANITVNVYRGTVSASGIARTSGAALVNCYNIGELNAKATYTHGVRAAGLADWAGYTTFYNGFSAGPLVGAAGTAAAVFTTNTNGVKANKAKNLYAFGHQVILNDAHSLASALPTVADDAYTTGELAWSLNENYEPYTGYSQVYYTLKDGKTVFGDSTNQTRKVTLVVGEEEETEVKYYNSGESITLGYGSNATYDITEGTAGLVDGVLTLNGEDVTINVTIVGANTAELQECYNAYAGKKDYLATSNGKLLSELLNEAKAILDDSSNVAQDDVDAMVKEFADLEYRAYPNVPLASEFEDYSDAKVFRIAGIDDMNYVAENSTAFTAEMELHFAIEGNEITVPDGALANSWNGVNAAIDGHGVTIIGVDYVGSRDTTTTGDAWLGNYAGAYLKNITFKDWTATTLGQYGAVVVSSVEASTEFADLHFINCTATKQNGNGMGILAGVQDGDFHATFTNITFEGCTLNTNGRSSSSNIAFLIGRVSAGEITANKIYLNNNKYTCRGSNSHGGRGVVIGECTATATFTDIGVFNTTYEGTATIKGLIGGRVKSGATVTYTNIITGNNGDYPMVWSEGTVNLTFTNVYTDAPYMEDGATQTAGNITTAQALNGYAAAQLNTVDGAAKWEILPNATAPSFDTDGLGLPFAVDFVVMDAESKAEKSTTTLYTNTAGNVVGVADLLDDAVWVDEANLATKTYTEPDFENGYVAPEHECAWEYTKGEGTHTAVCTKTWTPEVGVVVECDEEIAETACEYEYVKNDATSYEEAAHIGTCVCGDTKTVLCSEDTGWTVETTEAGCLNTGSTTYDCSICDHYFEVEIPALEHDYEDADYIPVPDQEGYHYQLCNRCDAPNEAAKCNLAWTDNDQNHTCDTCNYTAECSWSKWEYNLAIAKADYKHIRTCTVGGQAHTEEEDCVLVEDATLRVEPTCYETGSATSKCATCGASYEETLAATGLHTYKWVSDNAGKHRRECTFGECGNATEWVACDTTWDGAAHKCDTCNYTVECNYNENEVAHDEATKDAAAMHIYTCTVDGEAHTKSEACKFEATSSSASCTEAGITTYKCSVCEYEYTTTDAAALGHKYDSVVTAPKCEEEGYTTHTCSVCNDEYVDTYVNALGHAEVRAPIEGVDGQHKVTCSRCDYNTTEDCTITSVETAPSFDADGFTTYTCSVCGDSYVVTAVGTQKKAVAKIGDERFESLEAAIAAADGNTVTLLSDVTLSESLRVDKQVTIDLGGNTITSTYSGDYAAIYVAKTGDLTITGEGSIEATEVAIGNYGKVTINGGTITGGTAALYNYYYAADYYGTATIAGGELNIVWNSGVMEVTDGTVGYLDNSHKLDVTGGTITDLIVKEADYAPVYGTTTSVTGGEIGNVAAEAQIGSVYYATLEEAIAAVEDGNTVVLLADTAVSESIVIEKDITLDLGGKTLSATEALNTEPVIRVLAEVTVTNGKVDGTNGDSYAVIVGNTTTAGTLKIADGIFKGSVSAISITKGIAKISGGEFMVAEDAVYGTTYLLNCIDAAYRDGSAKYEISGGKFHGFNPFNNAAEGANTNYLPEELHGTETAEGVFEISAHDFVAKEGLAATCTTDGYTAYEYCEACETEKDKNVITATGHSYDSVVTEPTSTEQGYTTHTCSACGDSYVDSYVDALGYVKGDIDGDDNVSIRDAVLLLRYACGDDTLSGIELNLDAADANGDGDVNTADVVWVLQALLN